MECCRDSCPSRRFSHLHRGTLELCQSDHRVLGHLPDQGPSPSIVQFGRATSSRISLGGSKLLPFKNGDHCVLGDLQCCRKFLVLFPRSVPRHNPVSELYGQFLCPHALSLWGIVMSLWGIVMSFWGIVMSLWGIECRLMRKTFYLIHFRIRL